MAAYMHKAAIFLIYTHLKTIGYDLNTRFNVFLKTRYVIKYILY